VMGWDAARCGDEVTRGLEMVHAADPSWWTETSNRSAASR